MTKRIGNPLPFFTDKRGLPMDGGRLYIGEANEDPQLSPLTIYLDEACTVPVAAPLLIVGGLATNDGNPAFFYVDADSYALRVRDRDGGEVYYFPDAVVIEEAWQPVNANLTAIASLTTTEYGRKLLEQANASAIRQYIGLVPSLPITGGVLNGDIARNGGGGFIFHSDPALVGTRIFITGAGQADPTSRPGDIWLEKAP